MMLRVVASTSSSRPACAGTTRTTLFGADREACVLRSVLDPLAEVREEPLGAGPSSRRSVAPFFGRASSLEIFRWLRCQPPGP